jgi:cell division protein FtsZ
MIHYNRDPQQTIPASAVKIIGLGGAGANMLERVALDGVDGASLLALNTDIRTLNSCLAQEKIQLGVNFTRGLGAGGDPLLGHQAMMEAEETVRASIRGCRIVFLCTGLGGGTGSGAAPIVTRIAREEGAFVVVFATMPFAFEGKRRRDQADTALNELAVLSNALVTFDNNRMGELVLAKQGIHEAFAAADHMICESIKAVIRLVIRPGLINVGLDDLMSALRTNRSRCLFGSGIAEGKDRAAKALRNALNSPLLDQGTLLKDAQAVLVHLCGGEDLTLFEIELLMQGLQKFVPEKAHVLFGAAIDPTMGDSLSITLISALPEDSLVMAQRESISPPAQASPLLEPSQGFTSAPAPVPVVEPVKAPVTISVFLPDAEPEARSPEAQIPETPIPEVFPEATVPEPFSDAFFEPSPVAAAAAKPARGSAPLSKFRRSLASSSANLSLFEEERPFAEPDFFAASPAETPPAPDVEPEPEPAPEPQLQIEPEDEPFIYTEPEPEPEIHPYTEADEPDPAPIESTEEWADPSPGMVLRPQRRSIIPSWGRRSTPEEAPAEDIAPPAEPEPPKLKLGIKSSVPQSELSLDSTPRGRFEGESPNVFEGEDLDLPPFLRKKK